MFTPQEKAKCVLWMAELKSPTLVQRQFRTTFHKEPPTRRDLYAWTKKFEGTGSVLKEHTGGRTRSEDDVERIRCAFGSSPRKSIRCASAELQIPRSTVHRVVRKQQPLQGVGETILVLSGKGGVGKSTVSVQLATSLNALGYRVGILDIDLCGPSVPRMVGVEGQDVLTSPDGKWLPVAVNDQKTLSVISLAFFLESKNDAVIWRGPKKNAMIKQLLRNVAWKVDFLIIDTPPGTSDEHISILENLSECRVKGAVLVTTPQMVAVDDVTRELTFCRRTGMNVLGIIENMSGFVCPNCSECSNILATGGGEQLAKKSSVPFLGRIPIDPSLVKCLEGGENYSEKFPTSQVALVYKSIAENLSKDTMEIDC